MGDVVYKFITSDRFSPEEVLSRLDLTSEQALEVANRVEASINVWHHRHLHEPEAVTITCQFGCRSSMEAVKGQMSAYADKGEY